MMGLPVTLNTITSPLFSACDAKMNPSERTKKMHEKREAQIKEAQERKAAAEDRYKKAKKK